MTTTKRILPANVQAKARAHFNSIGEQVAKQLEAYIVPDEKIQKVVDYAIKMVCGAPHMKVERIVRKTVEEFKLKLKSANPLRAV